MSEVIQVRASMCSVSPLNVRKIQNETANLQLRTSILSNGILQSLVGLPVPRKKGRYEITAGGRRLSQVHAAIELGLLPRDYSVPLMPMTSAADAQEASLVENFHRLAMNPADECVAFRHIMAREGATASDVAKRFGIQERFVLGRLRLAGLADVVFDALRDGKITLDYAMAFAVTSDTARQASVFETYSSQAYTSTAIRRFMLEGGYRGSDPRARFVGRAAYEAAGGLIDADLFQNADEETWLDRDLLERLAEEKLAANAEMARIDRGLGSVIILAQENDLWRSVRGFDRSSARMSRSPTRRSPKRNSSKLNMPSSKPFPMIPISTVSTSSNSTGVR